MSKKIITCTSQGIRESISGGAQSIPSSAEFRLSGAALVENTTYVAAAATGTLTTETVAVTLGGGLIVLPASPTVGQRVTVFVSDATPGTPATGVSASHTIGDSGALGINLSSSNITIQRDFYFLSANGVQTWLTPSANADGPFGLTGTYTF